MSPVGDERPNVIEYRSSVKPVITFTWTDTWGTVLFVVLCAACIVTEVAVFAGWTPEGSDWNRAYQAGLVLVFALPLAIGAILVYFAVRRTAPRRLSRLLLALALGVIGGVVGGVAWFRSGPH